MNGLRKFVVAALVLAPLPTATLAQQPGTISGRVTAETGAPLGGATVSIEGATIGATTDQADKGIASPLRRLSAGR